MQCYTAAKKIVQTLTNAGFVSYFAGGWVRDHLLNKDADDIDIATTATPEQIMELFPKTIPVGINFSILIVVQDEIHCEVATFRTESEYADGRRPTNISYASPQEDAKRRDFTINGMFFDPLTNTVFDYVNGKQDLKDGVIRAIGDPHERFKEDRLRMIRACRYSARFSFSIDPNTVDAILAHSGELFPAVAIERVYDEFKKMTRDSHLFDALLLMHRFGLLEVIFKDLTLTSYEILEKRLTNLPKFPEKTYPTIYLYELFDNLSLKEKISLCKYFKVSNSEMKFTKDLDQWKGSKEYSLYALAKLYSHPLSEKFQPIASIYADDKEFNTFHTKMRKKLKQHILRLKNNTPLLTSKDLLDIGMKEGKKLGQALKLAEELAINHDLSTKKEVLTLLQSKNY